MPFPFVEEFERDSLFPFDFESVSSRFFPFPFGGQLEDIGEEGRGLELNQAGRGRGRGRVDGNKYHHMKDF